METWLYELFICLLIPMAMLINGILHLRRPPKSINWHYGYRTKRSMKSQEAWEFVQQYCGRLDIVLLLTAYGKSVGAAV